MSGVPTIYERVTIGDLLNACFDKLGAFNKKLLSDKFILSQGIWLTDDEKKELTEYEADGTMRKWLDVVKERLFLANVRLRIDQKGLSYSEFRSLIQMDKLPKISAQKQRLVIYESNCAYMSSPRGVAALRGGPPRVARRPRRLAKCPRSSNPYSPNANDPP